MSTKRAVSAAAIAATISMSALTFGTGFALGAPGGPTAAAVPELQRRRPRTRRRTGTTTAARPATSRKTRKPTRRRTRKPTRHKTRKPTSHRTRRLAHHKTRKPARHKTRKPTSHRTRRPARRKTRRPARRKARRLARRKARPAMSRTAVRRPARRPARRATHPRTSRTPGSCRRRQPNRRTRLTPRTEPTLAAAWTWAVRQTRGPASALKGTALRRRRGNTGGAGTTARLRAARHPTGRARRLRAAGAARRLPVAGTAGGTGHRATSWSRRPTSDRSPSTTTW